MSNFAGTSEQEQNSHGITTMKLEVYLEKCCTAIVVQQNAVEDFCRKNGS